MLTDPASFPGVHRAIDAGAFEDGLDPDAEFEFGLACILDGIEALIRRNADQAGSASSQETRPSK